MFFSFLLTLLHNCNSSFISSSVLFTLFQHLVLNFCVSLNCMLYKLYICKLYLITCRYLDFVLSLKKKILFSMQEFLFNERILIVLSMISAWDSTFSWVNFFVCLFTPGTWRMYISLRILWVDKQVLVALIVQKRLSFATPGLKSKLKKYCFVGLWLLLSWPSRCRTLRSSACLCVCQEAETGQGWGGLQGRGKDCALLLYQLGPPWLLLFSH